MLQALFDYFYILFSLEFPSGDMLEDSLVSIGGTGETHNYVYQNGVLINEFISHPDSITLDLPSYFALLCSLISLVIIVVICCLFIYRLIRLVGRLFSGGAL